MILDACDYTLNRYNKICSAINLSHYKTPTIAEYLESSDRIPEGVLLMRHDVDSNIRSAVDMAKIEHDHSIRSTYYIRYKKRTFVPETIEKIRSYGHDIGYHYENMDDTNGDVDRAIGDFNHKLSEFRKHFTVKTACMHGNPLTRYDNRDIWNFCSLSDFSLLGEPYMSIDYGKFEYFSDSGRSWKINENKIKDRLLAPHSGIEIHDSGELIRLVDHIFPKNICILTHPERWRGTIKEYLFRLALDSAYIAGKRIILTRTAMKRTSRLTGMGQK